MSADERPTLGEYLRRERKARGKTQFGISKETSVNKSYLSTVESGAIKDPSVTRLIELSTAYDTPLQDILAEVYGVTIGNEVNDSAENISKRATAQRVGEMVMRLPEPERSYIIEFTQHLLTRLQAEQ